MDVSSPPLMRKLLIGQLTAYPQRMPKFDATRQVWFRRSHQLGDGKSLVWSLVWIQGTVLTHSDPQFFILDDATGRISVNCRGDTAQESVARPTDGEYVAVIGRLLESNGDCPLQISAKSVISISRQLQFDPPEPSISSISASELSWPFEVKDMTFSF
ncbi:hypothetical protein CRM22_001770 [Opisthorchis felineus]|uniref:OB domain-containing protein n=1 Tax=Opisthorchis felineus TaxID=147828 RepID=A0A4S2M919_OPIFE|nr:hypothetical protein CRM22_001770 [Opisthorchis felineus]